MTSRMRWECRYSSSEMFYLELEAGGGVRAYLHHSPERADHFSADEVLAGEWTGEVKALFTSAELVEVQQAVRVGLHRSAENP